jgi:hypothetical protein
MSNRQLHAYNVPSRARVRTWLAWLLPCLWYATLARAQDASEKHAEKPKEKAAHLIVDYLPWALYREETFTTCFRIESSLPSVTWEAEARDAGGQVLWRQRGEAAPNPFAEALVHFKLETHARFDLRLLEQPGGPVLDELQVTLLQPDTAWPGVQVSDGRLADAQGRVVVPVVERRLNKPSRHWKPVSWLMQDDPAPEASVAVLPGGWADAETARRFEQALGADSVTLLRAGPYRGPAPGLLQLQPKLLSELGPHADTGILLVLPPEDVQCGTDARVYQVLLESLVSRLRIAGHKHLALAPPSAPGVPAARLAPYLEACREICLAYQIALVDQAAFLDEKLWRIPGVENAYGAAPQAEPLLGALREALHDLRR